MTNYNISYDTLRNYQEPIAPIVERASPSQLENSVNTQVPPLPRQSRKIPAWKKAVIGSVITGVIGVLSLGGFAFYGYSKAMDAQAQMFNHAVKVEEKVLNTYSNLDKIIINECFSSNNQEKK